MKECVKCKIEKPFNEFYKRKSKRTYSYCKPCFNSYCVERWRKKKIRAIEYMGGKCIDCKRQYPYPVYDFHHLYDKDYDWSKLRLRAWTTIITELDKCVLLCSNCHRMRHLAPPGGIEPHANPPNS